MKIIQAGFCILEDTGIPIIERAARTCYKSEDKITADGESARKMIKMLIDKGHEAMLEHSMLSVQFTTDRGVSHELVRHRMASFAQESTRYCNYGKDRFGNGLTFVFPSEFSCKYYEMLSTHPELGIPKTLDELFGLLAINPMYAYILDVDYGIYIPGLYDWANAIEEAEDRYVNMLDAGCTPQLARSVLPNSLKTDIVVTANYREWRHILKLRTAEDAHPDMRSLMRLLLSTLTQRIPGVFDDIQ